MTRQKRVSVTVEALVPEGTPITDLASSGWAKTLQLLLPPGSEVTGIAARQGLRDDEEP